MEHEPDTFIDKKIGEMGNWVAMHEYEGKVLVGVGDYYDFITKKEAIAAARAILAHFGEAGE